MPLQNTDNWLSDVHRRRLIWVLWWTLISADAFVVVARVATNKPAPLAAPFLVALGGIAILLRRGHLDWAAHALSLLLASTTVAMTYLAGELVPILHCLAVIPLFTTFISGARAGLIWCVLTLLILSLTAWGVATLPLPTPTGRALPSVSVAVVVGMVFAVTFAFERTRTNAINAVKQRENGSRTLLRLLPDDVLRIDEKGEVLQRSPADDTPDADLAVLFQTPPVQDAIREALSSNKEQEVVEHVAARALNVRLIPVDKGQLLALVRDRSDAQKLAERVTKAELIASLERANRMSSIACSPRASPTK